MSTVCRLRSQIVVACLLACLAGNADAQGPRIWVLKEPSSIVEYDSTTFSAKQTTAVPSDVLRSPEVLQVNEKGQMLFAPNPDDPSPDVGKNGERFWFWDGKAGAEVGRESLHTESKTGSNQRIIDSSPDAYLSADGGRFYWFANEFSRLERESVDLAVNTTFRAWSTDSSGKDRHDITSLEMPECRCTTGTCSETCPQLQVWAPQQGVADYFFLSRVIPGQTGTKYISTSLYQLQGGEWHPRDLPELLQRILDTAEDGAVIVNAIPDTGCCGWENQSNDQTILLNRGKKTVLFDEREQYKNPDYDVSFYTVNARLSPDSATVAMTIQASLKPGDAIQLSEDGQGNPTESQRIRKALTELPAVQIMSVSEPTKRLAFVPHASLAGWLDAKEVLIVENQLLIAYDITTGARRTSNISVPNPAFVFVR
jgi:hypothetical protein